MQLLIQEQEEKNNSSENFDQTKISAHVLNESSFFLKQSQI
jgi:hypothetical protein